MDKPEAKRRARWAAAGVVESALANGWELEYLTDNGSDRELELINTALNDVCRMLRRGLPEDYEPVDVAWDGP